MYAVRLKETSFFLQNTWGDERFDLSKNPTLRTKEQCQKLVEEMFKNHQLQCEVVEIMIKGVVKKTTVFKKKEVKLPTK